MKSIIYFIVSIVTISLLFSCNDDEKYSSSSNLRLTFSSDTVSFDTVFATIGTSTRRLKVYNRDQDALMINSVKLMNASATGFRMNVDGESGNEVNNVSILGGDSIYVFIETTIDPLNENNPILISDSIRFQFNGVNQYVHLEAIGRDATIWRGKVIDKDTTLTSEKPFLIYDQLHINNGVTLNIEKNTYLYFHNNAELSVSGTVNAIGTIEEPIFFRGDRTDNILRDTPYNRVPGQWNGIHLKSGSYNNHFENVRIHNGIYGVKIDDSSLTDTKAYFLNTVIQNTTKEVISAVNAKIEAKNSLFANAGTYTLDLKGGSYNLLQCTVVNYLSYPGIFRQGTIKIEGTTETPISDLKFINTIVSGSGNSKSEIKLNLPATTNYSFINCLLRVAGTDDTNFINTVWDENPRFKTIYTIGDEIRYYYNFELTESSGAINKASRNYASELPYDIRGVARTLNNPDIGCFEWKEN